MRVEISLDAPIMKTRHIAIMQDGGDISLSHGGNGAPVLQLALDAMFKWISLDEQPRRR